ncbi:acyltransferase family protein [Pedobacter sp.]
METKPQRLLSLDFFRGLTVAAMILVNNPGSWAHIYPPLEHAEWHGCTPTDLVFPFFLFIVGVSIAYAMGSKREDHTTHSKTIFKALKRSVTLFLLGFILAFFPRNFSDFNFLEALSTVRIPGVLQRIAVVFFISSVLFLKLSDKRIFQTMVVLLFGYWALMNFVPVPDFGPANLEKETNLGAWLDRTILTEAHLWKSAKTWDPEGILSTLPAICTCLFGVLVGVYLKKKNIEPATKIAWLFSVGTLAVIGGLLWGLQFPINKALWTSSYVLYTGGLATIILSLSYWLIDVNQYNRFTKPFVVYGVNAITVFFLSGLMPRLINMFKVDFEGEKVGALSYTYKAWFAPAFSNPLNSSLAYAIAFVMCWYVILWAMYKKNIIIKV